MGTKLTDAIVESVLIDIVDEHGRRASISFEGEHIVFHNSRPMQGKKAAVALGRLLDLALLDNPAFFDKPVRRRK